MRSLEHKQHISDGRMGKGCGENNGRWTPKIHKRCDHCGTNMITTSYRISKGMGKCCSRECAGAIKAGIPSPKRTGETRNCTVCGKEFYATPGQIKKGFGTLCSMECNGVDRAGKPSWNKGKACPQLAKENNSQWKGGTANEAYLIRGSREYKLWRQSVYKRDFFTCQSCGVRKDSKKGIDIHAHHILAFAYFPHKRTDISNGITLCVPCHDKAHGKKEKQ